jgi:hypothetical protein
MIGYVTGKKTQTVPWGSIMKRPSSWISHGCVPKKFKWKDPSHIKMKPIFRLLNHWRKRQNDGLEPLIWLPTCPLLQGENGSFSRRKLRSTTIEQAQLSDEEVFDLPSSHDSDEMDEDLDGNSDDQADADESSDELPTDGDLPEDGESADFDMQSPPIHMSQKDDSSSGEYDMYLIMFTLLSHALCHVVLYRGCRKVCLSTVHASRR